MITRFPSHESLSTVEEVCLFDSQSKTFDSPSVKIYPCARFLEWIKVMQENSL